MTSYVLRVNYGETESVDVPVECDPDDAETLRQALVSRIEHAHQLEVPEISAGDDGAAAQIALDPARVTSVDLVNG
jgi:hypothetical protein